MARYRTYNGIQYNYYGSAKTRKEARRRVANLKVKYRITHYGSGYKWSSGYDIWVCTH